MALFLMSEKLLEEELSKKPENPTDQQEFYYSMIEKELHVLRRLDIEICDLRGDEKEVAAKLERGVVAFCSPEELNHMRRCVEFKRDIMHVINQY